MNKLVPLSYIFGPCLMMLALFFQGSTSKAEAPKETKAAHVQVVAQVKKPLTEVIKENLSLEVCDDSPRRYTLKETQSTYARIRKACEGLGASKEACIFLLVVAERESNGRAGVRHTLGKNENGVGALGLSLKWHASKWPGSDEDPMFCVPEVSTVIALKIMYGAVKRFNAKNWVEVQAIYGGRWTCEKGRCRPLITERSAKDICRRLKRRGLDCRKKIRKKDLPKVPFSETRSIALKLRSQNLRRSE